MSCLQSLAAEISNPVDDLEKIRTAKGEKVSGTCEWIVAQAQYTLWTSGSCPQLLWLSGGPGIGKTMISIFLVEELTQLVEQSSQRMTLTYFFCDDKYERRRTATTILRVLLLQILQQRPILFKHMEPDFLVFGSDLFTNFYSLWRIFSTMTEDEEAGDILCIIDALDECEPDSRRSFLTNLERLFNSQKNTKTRVRFLVTSRRLSEIEESLASIPAMRNLQIDSARINGDLHKFINTRVDELSRRKGYNADLQETIKRTLMQKAEGTFLYVSLILDDLARTQVLSMVREKLRRLPPDLNTVYDKILSQIEEDYIKVASSVLRWVAVARRPLTMKELAMARSLEGWDEDIAPSDQLLFEMIFDFRCCGALVYLDPLMLTVNLVHHSAKEYLIGKHLQENHDLSQYHVDLHKTHLILFRACWTYLGLKDFKHEPAVTSPSDPRLAYNELSTEARKHCFFEYADVEWVDHALAAHPILPTHYNFSRDTLDKSPLLRDTWLLQASAEGQKDVVHLLLMNGADLEARDLIGQTPLSCAAEKGCREVVILLLKNGAQLEAGDFSRRTPLSYAAKGGHPDVVNLFLEKGAELEAEDSEHRTPLFHAARRELDSTPFSFTARTGNVGVVNLLLDKGAALDSRDWKSQTPLFHAVQSRDVAVVELLLDRGAKIELRDSDDETPLSLAVRATDVEMVDLLVKRGAEVNARVRHGEPLLLIAAEKESVALVKSLLERGAEVNVGGPYSLTPLLTATRSGDVAVVEELLKQGAEVDVHDMRGRTPLSIATLKEYWAIVKLLRDATR